MTSSRLPSRRFAAFLGMAILCATALPVLAEPTTQRASCVLRVEDEGNYGNTRQVSQMLVAMLTSTAIVNPSMEVLGLTPEQWPQFVQLDAQPVGELGAKLSVVVKSTGERTFPPDAATRVLQELASRSTRAFNGDAATKPADNRAARIAALEQRRAELDTKIAALRNELATLENAPWRRDTGARSMQRSSLVQQRDMLRAEAVAQEAGLKAIDEQIAKLPKEESQDMTTLRVRLIGMRVDMVVNTARNTAKLAEFERQIAELEQPLTPPTSQGVSRSNSTINMEMNDLTSERMQLNSEINNIANSRPADGAARKGRLVVLDGSIK